VKLGSDWTEVYAGDGNSLTLRRAKGMPILSEVRGF